MRIDSCNENWDKMTPNQQGRYCEVCSTTVLSLNDKSLEDIESLKEEKGKICGRVSKFQVSEFQYLHPMKRFAIALFLVFGTGLFTTSYAQVLKESEQIVKQNNEYTINFRAESKDGNPLQGVYISFDTYDQFLEGKTDEEGKLTLSYKDPAEEEGIYINISYGDIFGSVQFRASSKTVNNFDRIIFNPDHYTLTIGNSVFYEEFIMGDIAPIEWEEDPYEQKTEDN